MLAMHSPWKSLISPKFDLLFTDAPLDNKKTLFLSAESKPCLESAKIMASFKPGASWLFPGAVSQVHLHMMAGQNKFKEKLPDVSDPNQNVETTGNFKLKFYIT